MRGRLGAGRRNGRFALQGPLLDADCGGGCEVKLHRSSITLAGGSVGPSVLLGGNADLDVRSSSLRGVSLASKSPTSSVSATISVSRCHSCSIDPSILNTTAIVNSEFTDPPLQGNSSVSCEALQKTLKICDRNGGCADNPTGGRQCSCPSGFEPGTDGDGSRCLDLCLLAQKRPVYADGSRTALDPVKASVTDSTRLDFSDLRTHLKGNGIDTSTLSVWIVPTNGVHSVPLADTTGLIKTGSTITGTYDVQLRNAQVICKVVDDLRVRCTPGYSTADADGMACMPIVNITAAGIRIFSSTGDVLFDGGRLIAPIIAGDKLRVEVQVHDINGKLVTRGSLGLEVALEQMLAGKSKNNTSPMSPPTNSSTAFELTIPEMWISEAAEFQSAGSSCRARGFAECGIKPLCEWASEGVAPCCYRTARAAFSDSFDPRVHAAYRDGANALQVHRHRIGSGRPDGCRAGAVHVGPF
jgi:hypothetical protein